MMNRRYYWASYFGMMMVFGMIIKSSVGVLSLGDLMFLMIVALMGIVAMSWFRFRDLGKPGWWSFYLPVGALALQAALGSLPTQVYGALWVFILGVIPGKPREPVQKEPIGSVYESN